jgi:predicted TIM-barrel fold metal-dependent hydrolase
VTAGGTSDAALDDVTAIDVHVHVEQNPQGQFALDDELNEASAAHFRSGEDRTPTLERIVEYYRERRMAAVVFTVDAATATGHPALSSEEIATAAAAYPDVIIPFGSVDPLRGPEAVAQAERLVLTHGVRGFKFHPSLQAFRPDGTEFYPLYEAIEALEVPALFHTGQTGIGAGLPGGRGIKLAYSNPMLLDAVAADFPKLTIILAHPSTPWQDEGISIATHKANVFVDLSGWAPKYFPTQLVRAINGPLRHKALFGSDFPLITPDRWLADFAQLDIKDEVRPLVLKENARGLLTR